MTTTPDPRDLAEIIADAVEASSYHEVPGSSLVDLDEHVSWDSVASRVALALDPKSQSTLADYAVLAEEVVRLRRLRDDLMTLWDARQAYDNTPPLGDRAREWRLLVKSSRDVAALIEMHRVDR